MIQEIIISRVEPGNYNPRKKIDPAGIQELANSIDKQGLLCPITVRLKDGVYKVVAGERRYHACKLLGHEFIAADIRELTDREALECALAENMIRRDIHPLEEMDAFIILMDEHALSAEEIALRFGKSVSYIYKRLKLRDLCEVARNLFQDDLITLSHCFELIKVFHEDQEACIDYIMEKDQNGNSYVSKAPKDIEHFIANNIEVKLSNACFKLDNPKLVADVGPCTTCQFRSGFNKLLFPEVLVDDICYNPGCFRKKTDATIDIIKQKEIKKGNTVVEISSFWYVKDAKLSKRGVLSSNSWKEIPESHKCDQEECCTAIGIMVEGDGIGSKKYISIEKNNEGECSCLDSLYWDEENEKYTTETPDEEEGDGTSSTFVSSLLDKKTISEIKEDCQKSYCELKASEKLKEKLADNISPGILNIKMLDLMICMYVKYMDQEIFYEIIKPRIPELIYKEILEGNDEDLNAKFIVEYFSEQESDSERIEFLSTCIIKDALSYLKVGWFKNSVKSGEAPDLSKMVFELFEIDLKLSVKQFKEIWDKFELIPENAYMIGGSDKETFFRFLIGLEEEMKIENLEAIIKECEIDSVIDPTPKEAMSEYILDVYCEELKKAVRDHFAI